MLSLLTSLFIIAVIAKPDGPVPEGKAPPKPEGKEGKEGKPEGKEGVIAKPLPKVQPNDAINLQPMRDCSQCWECYACTHDVHYGTVGNCVPILGCIPSECNDDSQCGYGRLCEDGVCRSQGCSTSSDCDGGRHCYYGECRDTCHHSSDCSDHASGDICEHGLCGMFCAEVSRGSITHSLIQILHILPSIYSVLGKYVLKKLYFTASI